MRHCRVWNLESRDEGLAGQVGSFMQLGARTYLACYPDEELLLVVLDNSKSPRIDAIVQELTMVLTAC